MTKKKSKFFSKGVSYGPSGEVLSCLFCRIHQKLEPATIVFENDEFVVFKTIEPVTHMHYLVTPRKHVKNAGSLKGKEGIEMIEKLVEVGKEALGEEYAADALYCFHMPPFNSIDHLHLHAIASPETMNSLGKRRYDTNNPLCLTANTLIDLLKEKSRNI